MGVLDIEYMRDFARKNGMKNVDRSTNRREICLFFEEDENMIMEDFFRKYHVKEHQKSSYRVSQKINYPVYKHYLDGTSSGNFGSIGNLEKDLGVRLVGHRKASYIYKKFIDKEKRPFYISFEKVNRSNEIILEECRSNKINIDFKLLNLGLTSKISPSNREIFRKLGLVFQRKNQKRIICEKIDIPYYQNVGNYSHIKSDSIPVIAFDNKSGRTIPFASINDCVLHFHTNENNIRVCIERDIDFPYESKLWSIIRV